MTEEYSKRKYRTVKNGEKTLANLANYSISLIFFPIFTISITFPMQMDFSSPKFSAKLPTVLIHQNVLLPNFFTVRQTIRKDKGSSCLKRVWMTIEECMHVL